MRYEVSEDTGFSRLRTRQLEVYGDGSRRRSARTNADKFHSHGGPQTMTDTVVITAPRYFPMVRRFNRPPPDERPQVAGVVCVVEYRTVD
jgi:hypothetical protein